MTWKMLYLAPFFPILPHTDFFGGQATRGEEEGGKGQGDSSEIQAGAFKGLWKKSVCGDSREGLISLSFFKSSR